MNTKAMKLNECIRRATDRLIAVYPPGESKWLVRIIFEQLKGYTTVDLLMKSNDEVSEFIAGKVEAIVDRLLRHEPIQYIFGETKFYGLRLKVNRSTLIPRPETEELVDMIVKDWNRQTDLRVLDICTGSGCIAIALARNLPFALVRAIDISKEAIEVARDNSASLKTKVDFSVADALTLRPVTREYDIIVSNPPYIAYSERTSMDANVLDYEPSTALFVPDDDPLLFYRSIAEYAKTSLAPGGRLYMEINPLFTAELQSLLSSKFGNGIQILPDIHGHNRFAIASQPIT